MLAFCLKVVPGVALVPSTHGMLELGISEGLKAIERGAYREVRIVLYHPVFAVVKYHDEQTDSWMLQASKRDSAVGGWSTSASR